MKRRTFVVGSSLAGLAAFAPELAASWQGKLGTTTLPLPVSSER
jgi:hypothetical protein